MPRHARLTGQQRDRIRPLLPTSNGRRGRPWAAATYKSRNVVERSFALLKQWRGLATRFDKLAIVYRSAAVLAAVRGPGFGPSLSGLSQFSLVPSGVPARTVVSV